MGFRSVVLALALAACLAIPASCQGSNGMPEGEPFSKDDLSGDGIISDVKSAFHDEDIFKIREDTGMSPGVPEKGVRTPQTMIIGLGTMPVAGSWNIILSDSSPKQLHLSLIQSDDAVMGGGELMDVGGAVQVYAGGTVIGDRLALYVIPAGAYGLYRLALQVLPGSMQGSYVYSGQGFAVPGTASGSMAASMSTLPQAAPWA
jgi:hypothetical protein